MTAAKLRKDCRPRSLPTAESYRRTWVTVRWAGCAPRRRLSHDPAASHRCRPADVAARAHQHVLWPDPGAFRPLTGGWARPNRLSAWRQRQRQVDDDEGDPRTHSAAVGEHRV